MKASGTVLAAVVVGCVASAAGVRAQDTSDLPTSDVLLKQGFKLKKTVKRPEQRRWEYYVKGKETYVCDEGLFDTMGCKLQK